MGRLTPKNYNKKEGFKIYLKHSSNIILKNSLRLRYIARIRFFGQTRILTPGNKNPLLRHAPGWDHLIQSPTLLRHAN